MIKIDGSIGEGGGQILRTSLSLSLITGLPFHITKIRAGRSKPGLMHQHLTSVQAASCIGHADVEGDSIGSKELLFKPWKVEAGHYDFRVGSAGSVTLVFQTVLPALMLASKESTLNFEGGTHNPFAPPWDFLAKTFIPQINKMGPVIQTTLINPGFYPAGGGQFTASIKPSGLSGFNLCERGAIVNQRARAIISKLPVNIANRELDAVGRSLNLSSDMLQIEYVKDTFGPGNAVIIELESQNLTSVFTSFGERGISAETVAFRVASEVQRYMSTDAPVDPHLADQLMIPFALAGEGCYRTMPLTEHSTTNLLMIKKFLHCKVKLTELKDNTFIVEFG